MVFNKGLIQLIPKKPTNVMLLSSRKMRPLFKGEYSIELAIGVNGYELVLINRPYAF